VYTELNFDNYDINVTDFVTIDKRGIIWLGTWIGLVKFDGVNWTVYRDSNSGLPNEWIHVIVIDEEGNKWIGTNGGLAKFDGGNWIVYNESNSGLPDNWVLTISIDKEGNKWIGTGFRGIAVYREGGVIIKPVEIPPARFRLFQNYPNPFNSVTTIEFEVYERSFVRLVVYDVLGREVRRPFEGLVGMGRYRVNFDAKGLPSGIYFYRLEVEGQVEVKKMVLVK
jgi:hypothetical protein